MGLPIRELLKRKEIEIKDLNSKIIVIDTFNMLYQFLTTIRQRDGSLLTDSKGNVTSHLTGLFTRTANLLGQGLKLAFVFDGEAQVLQAAAVFRGYFYLEPARVIAIFECVSQ